MSDPAPHFVIVPVGLFGHIFPMIQLSVQLTSIGNKVTFITTHRTKKKTLMALESTLSQLEEPDKVHSNLLFLSLDDLDHAEELEQGGGEGIWANIRWMANRTSEVEDLVATAVLKQGPLTCMIMDFLALHFKQIADRHSAQIAPFWTPSTGFLLICLHLKELMDKGLAPLTPSNAHAVISDIQGLPKLSVYRDMPFALQQCSDDDPDFSFLHSSNKILLEAPFVIVNTIHGLESVAIRHVRELGMKLVTVGPLIPLELSTSPDQKEADVFKWLNSKPALSVLYVSFGTLAEISEEQLQELSSALEESGLNFLWVLRTGNVRNSDSYTIRSLGKGIVVPWCCQVTVLKHPAVGAFLTHCGWNSILESLCSGVPMIGWPCIAEQNLNCKYVVDVWRVGSRIVANTEDGSFRVVKRGEILDAINKVMVEEEGAAMRKRAQELKQLAGRSVQSSLTNLIFGLLDPLVKNRATY